MVKTLIVEDDRDLAEGLRQTLASQHYLVDVVTDGQAGWDLADVFHYDLILLDWMLPKLDGIRFCQQRRAKGDRTPILLMTSRDSCTDTVAGLDAGADDYIVKPFSLEELLARIRALLRRGETMTSPVLQWGSLRLDPSSCAVTCNGQPLALTAKEYALLELFLRHPRRIFSQETLLDQLWPLETLPAPSAVRAKIKNLRQKLKRAGITDLIETVYGLGYRLQSGELTVQAQNQGEQWEREGPDSSSQSSVSANLTALREQMREKYLKRIMDLEQVVATLRTSTSLSEALRQQVLAEAHTLAGSLGSFGFQAASQNCREIERMFQSGNRLSSIQIDQLAELIAGVRQELQQRSHVPLQRPTLAPTVMQPQPRLLIVDDDVALAQALGSAATAWGMRVKVAESPAQAQAAIARTRPDIVLLDLGFPNSTLTGLELLAALRRVQPPIPVLVLTAQADLTARVKVAQLGGQRFLQKPVTPTAVLEAIAQVLQRASPPMGKLLIVDGDPQMLDLLRTILEPWGFQLMLLDCDRRFWETLEQFVPDLLLLDLELPGFSGKAAGSSWISQWNNIDIQGTTSNV